MKSLAKTISVQVDRRFKELATGISSDFNKEGVPFEGVNSRPSKELLEAIQEGEGILNGKIKAKSYTNMYEMLKDLKE